MWGNSLHWETCVIVPDKLQVKVLNKLQINHPGITHMKDVAEHYVEWPKLNKHIEELVKCSITCQKP